MSAAHLGPEQRTPETCMRREGPGAHTIDSPCLALDVAAFEEPSKFEMGNSPLGGLGGREHTALNFGEIRQCLKPLDYFGRHVAEL
jgi:hypothetical protein